MPCCSSHLHNLPISVVERSVGRIGIAGGGLLHTATGTLRHTPVLLSFLNSSSNSALSASFQAVPQQGQQAADMQETPQDPNKVRQASDRCKLHERTSLVGWMMPMVPTEPAPALAAVVAGFALSVVACKSKKTTKVKVRIGPHALLPTLQQPMCARQGVSKR